MGRKASLCDVVKLEGWGSNVCGRRGALWASRKAHVSEQTWS